MSWNLNCRKVQRLLALWSGNDIDEAGRVGAERHMASCPNCRESWARLNSGRQALEQMRTAESAPLTASIWPALERQILVIDQEAATANWRGWLPVGALAAACLAIVVGIPSGQGPQTAYTPSGSASIPVFFSNDPPEGYRPNIESVSPDDQWSRHGERLTPGLLQGPRVRTLLDGTDVRGL